MKEWSSFVGFVVKEFYHIFRDRRTAAILFGMPVIQLLLFGYAIRNEIQEVKIGIADLSRDAVSQAITDKLLSSGTFVLIKNLQSPAEIEGAFRSGAMSEAIVFEPASGKEIQREGSMDIQVITDGSDPNVSRIVTGYTASVVRDYLSEAATTIGAPKGVVPVPLMMFNPGLKASICLSPGLWRLFSCLCRH